MKKKEEIAELRKELSDLRDKVSALETLVAILQAGRKVPDPLPAPWVNPWVNPSTPFSPTPYWESLPKVMC
jgi:hypothetical protein